MILSLNRRNGRRRTGQSMTDLAKRPLQVEALEPRHLLAASAIISEFMASNDSTLLDGDGNSSDWIELYNPTDQIIDLSGWHLTDDSTNLNKWPFPTSAQSLLQPGDHLLVFASGQATETYIDPAGYLHTDFKLGASGEYLGLTDANENIVFDFGSQYPQQITDVSYGHSFETLTLVGPNDTTSALVPTDGSLDAGRSWTQLAFNDSALAE